MELKKGANASLPGSIVEIDVFWEPGAAQGQRQGGQSQGGQGQGRLPSQDRVGLDVSAVRLSAAGKVRDDSDFVFFNAPATPDGTVRHLGPAGATAGSASETGETIRVDTGSQPSDVTAVVVTATVDVATPELTFAGLPVRAVVRDARSGATVATFTPSALSTERALVVVEAYRRGPGWKIRAVGQGYASGLAGLATDFGVAVEDPAVEDPAVEDLAFAPAPTPNQAPSRTPPSPRPPARPLASTGDATSLPVDMAKRLDLRKRSVGVVLKKAGIPAQRARVAVVLDASGSMFAAFRRGAVARTVERLAAVAARLDDDGTLDAWAYASNPLPLPPLAVEAMAWWIPLYVRTKSVSTGFGGAKETKAREAAARAAGAPVPDWSSIGGQNDEPQVMNMVVEHYRRQPSPPPALVLFLTDGGIYKNAEIEKILRDASSLPIFWQFVGVGGRRYGVLHKLDRLSGRLVDNAGFFAVDDLDEIGDDELYARLLGEFPDWLRAARAARIPV